MRDTLGGLLLATFAVMALLIVMAKERPIASDTGLSTLAKNSIVGPRAPAPVKGDWPQWRGPLRDGIAAESIPAWPEGGPRKLWETPVGEGYASVAVANGVVYSFFQVKGTETLVAYDAETGAEKWRSGCEVRYNNPYGDGPRATPTVDGDRVYTVGATGILHCVDVQSGEKRWSKDLLADYKAPTPKWGIAFSPLVDGNNLILHPGGELGSVVALDKRTGSVVWTALSDGGGYSSPLIVTLAGTRQIVVFTAGGLVGLDPAKGTPLWSFPWTTPWDCNIATPVVAGDYIFITSGYDRGCALVHIENTGGKWSAERVYEHKKLCSHFASCVLFGETLYGFHESTLVALKLRTGEILWKKRGFGKGSVLGAGESLIIMGESGVCALADASPDAYRERARFEFSNERCWSAPVLAHGRLYLRDQKTLACFDVNGK